MKWMHVKSVACVLTGLVAVAWPMSVEAQIAPTGAHYAGRATDTGHAAPTDSGGYAAAVPFELPPSRGGLPVPVQLVSGSRGFGAAGVGWDVPLSFVQFDFIGHRRPAFAPGESVESRERVSVSLPGQRLEMVRQGSGWIGRNAPAVSMRVENQKFKVFDGQGLTYTFADKASDIPHLTLLSGTGRFLLESIRGPGGATVALEYDIGLRMREGGIFLLPAVSVDLKRVSYNPHPSSGCFKHQIVLSYNEPSGILNGTGQFANTVTGAELRYIQANWARFQKNVTFLGAEGVPW